MFGVSDFLDFMTDTVTIEPWQSDSVSGVPTYNGTPVSFSARIEMKNHRIVDAMGREVLAKGKVFLATTTIPSTKDRLTLPAEYVPTQPPVLAVNVINDEAGTHHVTLEIG